jgi:S-adenosylmethionine:tRNA ribosyltransferase-isomerase
MSPPDPEARLRVEAFDYPLPTEAIAQKPIEPRDAARLLVLDRAASRPGRPAIAHRTFHELGTLLRPGDLLVINDSRVIPARLPATRPGGGSAEILLLRPREGDEAGWEALVRPSRRIPVGSRLTLRSGDEVAIGSALPGGLRAVRFDRDPFAVMAEAGETPLPPYIRDHATPAERYQTVYARPPGSAAAPTAGLHFTTDLLRSLSEAGVRPASVTLHVGLDTFRPVVVDVLEEHALHGERYDVRPDAWERIRAADRVLAVGTTSVRVLETLARGGPLAGRTSLFVTPGFEFRRVDALLTNFHLPRSTLLALVMAFAGVEQTRELYRLAVEERYRFYSFGDAMLIR